MGWDGAGLGFGLAPALASGGFADYYSGMAERAVRYQLGSAQSVTAESFGRPGRRTFRLTAEAGRALSYIWLEKEQLLQLAVYFSQALEQLAKAGISGDNPSRQAPWMGDPMRQDFHARQMQLQFDREIKCFLLEAFEGDENDPAAGVQTSVSFWMTVAQCRALAEQALQVCAAGRPPCFLCGMPIDPGGHRCRRASGHAIFETG